MPTPATPPEKRKGGRKPLNRTPHGRKELFRVWFESNGVTPQSLLEYCPKLLQLAEEFKYIHWPFLLREYVRGKDVVDLGCGKSLHGIGYLMVGVKSYTGLDPVVEMERDAFKDSRMARVDKTVKNMKPIGWTPAKIAKRLPRIRYRQALIGDLEPDELWDVLIMHNVTEHLMAIDDVFVEIPKHLRPGGRVIFSHPNFYSWNGHHMAPRFVDQIDPNNPEHKRYMDWAHLTFDPTWPATIIEKQSRIRLHELREVTAKYFEIEKWEPVRLKPNEGLDRWDPAILTKHPEFTEEELLTQRVFCVARRKS